MSQSTSVMKQKEPKQPTSFDPGSLAIETDVDFSYYMNYPQPSLIDEVRKEFHENYTLRPCTVMGADEKALLRVRKPSSEFLKVMDDIKSQPPSDTYQDNVQTHRSVGGYRNPRKSAQTRWQCLRLVIMGEFFFRFLWFSRFL